MSDRSAFVVGITVDFRIEDLIERLWWEDNEQYQERVEEREKEWESER